MRISTHERGDAEDLFAVDLSSRACGSRTICSTACARGSRSARCSATCSSAACTSCGSTQISMNSASSRRWFRVNAPPSSAARGVDRRAQRRGWSEAARAAAPIANLHIRSALTGLHLRAANRRSPCSTTPIDAVGDAVVAETAYQAVRGNIVRTGAHVAGDRERRSAAARARGGAHAAQRHRGGASRVVAAVQLQPAAPADAGRRRARAREPQSERVGGKLLGPLKNVRFAVERVGANGKVMARVELRASELALAPLDVVYLAPARPGEPMPEIDARASLHGAAKLGAAALRRRAADRSRSAGPLAAGRDRPRRSWPSSPRARGRCSRGARALDARDLAALQKPSSTANIDAAELEARATGRAEGADGAQAMRCNRDWPRTPTARYRATAQRDPRAEPLRHCRGSAPRCAGRSRRAAGPGRALCACARPRRGDRSAPRRMTARARRSCARVFGNDFLATAALHAAERGRACASLARVERAARRRRARGLSLVPTSAARARAARAPGRKPACGEAGARARACSCASRSCRTWPANAGSACRVDRAHEMPAGELSLVDAGADATLRSRRKPLAGLLDRRMGRGRARADARTTAITFQLDAPDARAPQSDAAGGAAGDEQAVDARGLASAAARHARAGAGARGRRRGARHRSAQSDRRCHGVGELAHFLPALHFAVNVDGDAVSPDFRTTDNPDRASSTAWDRSRAGFGWSRAAATTT